MMDQAHFLIMVAGILGLFSILAGLLSQRIGAPLLLGFLAIGMLAGEDGPGGLVYEDFRSAYLIGSIALAVILFEGGLKTSIQRIQLALWPSLALATIGVAITAGLVGAAIRLIANAPWTSALLAGAVVAPTDAAAVATLLRRARVAIPERVSAALEVESGLNDPMSIFLTFLLIDFIVRPGQVTAGHAALFFLREMGGGAALGLLGGYALLLLLRYLPLEASLTTVLGVAGVLALFGAAQLLHTSGFLAIYIAAVMAGSAHYPARDEIGHFFEGLAWLSQIVLFLMLGLLVTPHQLVPLIVPAVLATMVLILVARPVAVFACMLPFGYDLRETTFAAWVGLRGAVPIYLCIVPAASDARGIRLFDAIFVAVVASLIAQGWTIGLVARLLGYGAKGGAAANAEALAGEAARADAEIG